MLTSVIDFSLKNRFFVISALCLACIAGAYNALHLPLDAVPDLTNVQVTVISRAGSLSPVEVEQFVTYPVERVMSGLPHTEEIRSVSKFGLSVVTIVFKEHVDIYFARQLVAERLPTANESIATGYGPAELGPLTTALGEVLQFEVRGTGYSPMELRTILEWDIAPKLRETPGVTEVNTMGGEFQSFEIRPNPHLLSAYGITLTELYDRLIQNNGAVGGGYIVHEGEQKFIRASALLTSAEPLKNLVVRKPATGTPILVGQIADVGLAPLARQGCVTRDARGEAVTGMAMMLIGENSREVVLRVKDRLTEIAPTLPQGVEIEVIYDRATLIGRTLKTVVNNLIEGGLLVIVILLIMLGNLRAGLIVAMAIPMSMLLATNVMGVVGISASLMSLGAIDFGLIVDSSVIMIENCLRRLHERPEANRIQVIRDAAIEVRKPSLFGELIIAVVYLPILMLEGAEGKLFRPMAWTVLLALGGSLLLSLSFMPAAASLFLPHKQHAEKENWLLRGLKRVYTPILLFSVQRPVQVCAIALVCALITIPIGWHLGAEFMPRLDEGDLLVEAVRLPSASLEGAIPMSTRIEKVLLQYPEVKTVFSKTGRPEIANDVMGVHQTDVWVMLNHSLNPDEVRPREALIAAMSRDLQEALPDVAFGFTQPIEMRVDELVAGVKADVAVLLYGDDVDLLAKHSKAIERVLREIPGAADVKADYQSNLQALTITPRWDDLARYGLNAQQLLDTVGAVGGHQVGQINQGRARFPLMVRLPEAWRQDADLLEQLPVAEIGGKTVLLREVAEIREEESPPTVEHEAGRRRTFIACNVRGRDVATFVSEAQNAVRDGVALPAGYEVRWGGDFENLQSASLRLSLITPVVLLVIFLLLHASLGSFSLAGLIFVAVPIAASGGVIALWSRDMPFSISAGVGFIALFGVAVLNGLVWISAAENLFQQGVDAKQAAIQAGVDRLRPVLMTALVASFGFIPMALSVSAGAEIQRPLATVVIGGLVSSTLLTCFVLPAVYPWVARRNLRQTDIKNVPANPPDERRMLASDGGLE